ncbi:hypothetical protein AMS59_23720 [Lysinibacillus sp. FJAT-14745]|uniref:hypothetical protein n=1 Tax=Lysinibacillus sp. FJAT-14745 TaxID=1704289 RepID=UPI0006AB93A6|nr:hypothetical protein [Lysinibacillus sp. FJAT-14745]KOP69381.1 hypothetical protein AMS59_23720 [Lysinibacillus sp. FJAT-14745]
MLKQDCITTNSDTNHPRRECIQTDPIGLEGKNPTFIFGLSCIKELKKSMNKANCELKGIKDNITILGAFL